MRKLLLAASFIALFLLFGCVLPNPKAQYLSMVDKANSASEYKVVYDMQMPFILDALSALSSSNSAGGAPVKVDFKVGSFKKGSSSKEVVEMNLAGESGTYYEYNVNGKKVTCQKSSFLGTGAVECGTSSDQFPTGNITDLYRELNSSNIEVQMAGTKTIIGRTCTAFNLQINNMSSLIDANPLSGSSSSSDFQGTKGILTTCLDQQTGVALEMNISFETKSELVEHGPIKNIFYLNAISFSDKVDDSEFVPASPLSVIGSGCTPSELTVVFDSYKEYSGPVTLEVSSYNGLNQTIDAGQLSFAPFTTNKVTVQHGKGSDILDFRLCLGKECKDSYCVGSIPDNCIKYSLDQAQCSAQMNCIYTDPLCEPFACTWVKSEDQCLANRKCSWDAKWGCGIFTCSDPDTRASCVAHNECIWESSGYCRSWICADATSQQRCDNLKNFDTVCAWTSSGCTTCGSLPKDECQQFSQCRWDTDYDYCYTNY